MVFLQQIFESSDILQIKIIPAHIDLAFYEKLQKFSRERIDFEVSQSFGI